MKISLMHVGLNSSDMVKTLDFYINGLGMKHGWTMSRKGKPWIEYVSVGDNSYLEFFYEKEGRTYSYENGSFKHICLECEDALQYADEIKGRGYELWKEPVMGPDGNWQFWLKDPDGHQIEVIQVSADSPHARERNGESYTSYDFQI